jgi:mono/diheme cytochrome c family protein
MNKTFHFLALITLIGVMILSACGGAKTEEPAADEVIPDQYASMTNPSAGNADAAAAGKTIYDGKCASCHGAGGKGDGTAGAALNPKPADLTKTTEDPDGLLYWRIAEGGTAEPFKTQGSLMPAWKDILSKDEIWQVVTYVRSLK